MILNWNEPAKQPAKPSNEQSSGEQTKPDNSVLDGDGGEMGDCKDDAGRKPRATKLAV